MKKKKKSWGQKCDNKWRLETFGIDKMLCKKIFSLVAYNWHVKKATLQQNNWKIFI